MVDDEEAAGADLEPARLQALLTTTRLGRAYEALAACGSTNDEIGERARQGAPEGLVVTSERQSGGRGRHGRRWLSPAGENLMFSLLLRPAQPLGALPPLTLLVGVAVAEALAALGIRPRLKWPNDIVCDTERGPRKLCGILTEMATLRDEVKHVVVGVGINVNQAVFPSEIGDIATSLRVLTGQTHDRGLLLAHLLGGLERLYDQSARAGADAFLTAWRGFAELPRPCEVDRPGGRLRGTAIDVDADGALLVANEQGVHRVVAGELLRH